MNCLVKSTSSFLEVSCLLKSGHIFALYLFLSLFLVGSTEITAAAQEQ